MEFIFNATLWFQIPLSQQYVRCCILFTILKRWMKLVDFMRTDQSYNCRILCLVSRIYFCLLLWSWKLNPRTCSCWISVSPLSCISSSLNITIILMHLFILLTFTDGLLWECLEFSHSLAVVVSGFLWLTLIASICKCLILNSSKFTSWSRVDYNFLLWFFLSSLISASCHLKVNRICSHLWMVCNS